MSSLAPVPETAPAPAAAEPSADANRALALLDRLQTTFLPKAEDGDPAAALIVLSVLKQRAALLGLARSPAAALRVAATTSPNGQDKPGEVKLVVEYVNDWREVLRRRT